MRPKQRIRKIYTESDIAQRPLQLDENLIKANNINIKDLQLNLSDGNKSIPQQRNNKNYIYKNTHFYMPNKFNKINRKELIKKLPDINLASLNTISRPIKLTPLLDDNNNSKLQQRFSTTNKKNTFLLNSIFEILKPETTNDKNNELNRLKERTLKIGSQQKKNISIDSFYQNQFINVTNSSTKNRGPKIIQNQITRLSNHNNIMRRKIVSQEKSRPKYQDKSIDRLKQTTFQHFKRVVHQRDDQNEFTLLNPMESQPKENFQNLEIITFYNKFPGLKKKQEEKPIKSIYSQQIKYQKQIRPTFTNFKSKAKTQQPEYEEENEFIFEKN